MDSFRIIDSGKSHCTPVVSNLGTFPVLFGDMAPGASASATVNIDFSGCSSVSTFGVQIELSGDAGALREVVARYRESQ